MNRTHSSLRSTATLISIIGSAQLALVLLGCMCLGVIGASSSGPFDIPSAVIFIGVVMTFLIAPGIGLLACAGGVRRGSRAAVTVALVVSSLMTLQFGAALFLYFLAILEVSRYLNELPPGLVFALLISLSLSSSPSSSPSSSSPGVTVRLTIRA